MTAAYIPPAPAPRDRPFGVLGLLAALRRNPLECWTRRHFEALVVEARLPFGRAMLVNDPCAIRHVLFAAAGAYRKDRLQKRVLSAGMAEGLLSAEGERWRAQRRLAAPPFAHRSVRDFAPAMRAAAEAMVGRWPARAGAVDVDVEMRRVTLDVLERTIFADGFGRDAEDIRRAMTVYFDVIGKLGALDLLGAPEVIPRLSQLRVRSTLRFFEGAIDDLISARRRDLERDSKGAPQDMLTRLLEASDGENGLSPAEVRSNILTFFAAGHETTANTLTWALFLLSQSPEWMRRVEREAVAALAGPAETFSDRLTDTRAVIEEAVRLYPPIAAISRVSLGEDELAGVKVKRGTLVVISPWVLHRHQRLWDEPDAFDPRRFLGEARERIDKFAYLPFGAGPRTCIGQAFALQEAALVLATVVGRFSLQLAPGQVVWPLLRVTLRPAHGLRMIVRPKPAPPALARAA
ncbi:MAG TPA: cytochrome P450 [Caulobacteraceae bacterium]|jgi:cytochrome P450